MKILLIALNLIVTLLWSSLTWAEPYTYGNFSGSFNEHEPQAIYGDFDGDGRLDHVISQPEDDSLYVYMDESDDKFYNLDRINSARVSMYSDLYPIDDPSHTHWDHKLTPADLDPTISFESRTGSSLAAGDFDGDGDDELVVGMPYSDAGGHIYAGKVIIIDGDVNFPHSNKTVLYQGAAGTFGSIWGHPEFGDGFGDTLAVGDFDGNGIDDLAIGTPLEDMGDVRDVGIVILLYGYSEAGLFSDNYRLRQNDIQGESEGEKEYFGAALATGRFNDAKYLENRCYSLAVGAPGEDIGGIDQAGAAYVFLARSGRRLSHNRFQKLHQNIGHIASFPEANDQFGATLGIMSRWLHDGLWIGAINEEYATRCTEPEHIFYHRLYSDGTGLDTSNDHYYGGMFSPAILEKKQELFEVNTDYGPIAFYIPRRVNGTTVLVHGTNAGPDDIFECTPIMMRYAGNNGHWLKKVNLFGLSLIVPSIDNVHFGNFSQCIDPEYDLDGGYRYLFGGIIRPDGAVWGFGDWLNFILDELSKIDSNFGRPIYLYGHSAGAQFVTRYLWAYPERVQSAVIEAAGSHLWPDNPWDGLPPQDWPHGMGAYAGEQYWPGWADRTTINYDPAWDHGVGGDIDSRWVEILQKDIHVIVGENDGLPENSCDRLNIAHSWVEMVNLMYGDDPGTKDVTLCFVDDAGHTSDDRKIIEESAMRLFLNTTAGHCVTPNRTCLDWIP